jgi:substrate import-associated zinc metallohydrolase lipoprotein
MNKKYYRPIMKMIKVFPAAIVLMFIFSSCRKEEKLGNANDIPGLGGDTWTQGPIDKWILDSLTTPFNIDVAYKWNAFALNQLDKNVVPVKEHIVIPALSAVKRVWANTYVAEIGADLFKSYVPKFFVLAGSGAYNYDGTVLLGQAGGGRQIFLLELNYFRNKTMPGFVASDTVVQKATFHTVEHEFAHIFDQTKKRPFDFDKITQGSYSSDWINVSDVDARKDGFISAYASSVAAEDFAEMVSWMLIEGKGGFDAIVNSITGTSVHGTNAETAKARLHQKEATIVDYFKKSWNIDFYSLQTRTRAAINAEF